MFDNVLLGLVPMGKFVFSHEDAVRQKEALTRVLDAEGVRTVGLDGVLEDGIVRSQDHVDAVVAHLRAKAVDALFIPHCNFGTEGAVGSIARKLGVPVLLWGPRDGPPQPDGTRLRDTLCGLLASSKVLHKLGVPFSYIENCGADEPAFRDGLHRFLGAAGAAAALRRGLRIGAVGQRIDFFWTTIVNESELLERFGIEVLPIDMVGFLHDVHARAERNAGVYAKEVRGLREQWVVEDLADDAFARILAVRDQMRALVDERGLDALAVQDFDALVDGVGAYAFLADALVAEKTPVSLESDLHGAVSLVLLRQALGGAPPVFLTEFTVRHPTDDNGVLLWHAGAPPSMRHPSSKVRIGRHWILPTPVSGMPHFRLKDGPITVARFDGDRGDYVLTVGQGASMEGPETQNNYVWMKVDDWPHWERSLVEGPTIHHTAMAYAHCAGALEEACRFVPGLRPVRLDRANP